MVWAKLDDQYPQHRKMLAAGTEGFTLDVSGICWSSKAGTDGFIPDYALRGLYPVEDHARTAALLVEIGRWERDDQRGGWVIHDFLDYNPPAHAVRSIKEKRVEAGRRGGKAKRKADAEPNDEASATADAQANGETNGVAKRNPVPGPVPQNPSSSTSDSRPVAPLADDEEETPGSAGQTRPQSVVAAEREHAVAAELAGRKLASREAAKGAVGDRGSWLKRVADDVLERDGACIRATLGAHPEWLVVLVADEVERATSPQPVEDATARAQRAERRRMEENAVREASLAGVAVDPVVNAAGLAGARGVLRREEASG